QRAGWRGGVHDPRHVVGGLVAGHGDGARSGCEYRASPAEVVVVPRSGAPVRAVTVEHEQIVGVALIGRDRMLVFGGGPAAPCHEPAPVERQAQWCLRAVVEVRTWGGRLLRSYQRAGDGAVRVERPLYHHHRGRAVELCPLRILLIRPDGDDELGQYRRRACRTADTPHWALRLSPSFPFPPGRPAPTTWTERSMRCTTAIP